MTTLRIGNVLLLGAQALLLSAVLLWPAVRHPSYIKDAYRGRGKTSTEAEIVVVQAAWDRKRAEDRQFIIGGMCLMAILATPLVASIVKAGCISSAFWQKQAPPLQS